MLDKGHYLFRAHRAVLAITPLDLEGGPGTVEEVSSQLQVTRRHPGRREQRENGPRENNHGLEGEAASPCPMALGTETPPASGLRDPR